MKHLTKLSNPAAHSERCRVHASRTGCSGSGSESGREVRYTDQEYEEDTDSEGEPELQLGAQLNRTGMVQEAGCTHF